MRDIRDVVNDVNESLTDSQELTSTQRNALMLVHIINAMDDTTAKVDGIISSVSALQHLVDDHKTMYELLEHRVKVLEDNSIVNMLRLLLKFLKDNPKLAVGLIIAALMSLGAAPELVKLIAVMAGIPIP